MLNSKKTNELKNLLQTNDDLKILLILEDVKNDEEITKYINNLPKQINVLINTQNI